MKAGNRIGRTLPRRFQRLLLQLARQARRDLERVPRHPKRAVHALRTRMKKIPAIVHLVESRLPEAARRDILARAKRLKKAFDAVRDAQVAADLGFGHPAPVAPPAGKPLLDEAARLIRLIGAEPLDGLTPDLVRDAYVATYRASRRRMKQCLKNPDAARLHAWRKSVKEFFYQSLALHAIRGMPKRIRRARRLGRWLGQDHDWQLIIERHPSAAPRIASDRARLRKRIFKLAEKLFGDRAAKFARKLG